MDRPNQAFCITLNAAIDRTYTIPSLKIGEVNRVTEMVSQAGGKGNNVARAIHRMGGRVLATGFTGGQNGRFIEEALDAEGIPNDFCRVEFGESRVCLTVVDAMTRAATELIEPGIRVSAADMQTLSEKLGLLVQAGDMVVLSGSLPPGCTIAMFVELMKAVQGMGARVIVDTSGEALLHAAQSAPFAIKPNEHEVGQLLSAPTEYGAERTSVEASLFRAVVQLQRSGIELPIITLGGAGAIACNDQHIYRVHTPNVVVVNTVGSGDSFLGGLVYGLMEGHSLQRSLAIAAAAGAYNATQPSAATLDADEVLQLTDEVVIHAEPLDGTQGP